MDVEYEGDEASHYREAAAATITLDGSVYPIGSVLRACYALAEIATFDVSNEAGSISVAITPAAGQSIKGAIERFRTSLIDFALREEIEARTRGMRDLIWQTAFGEMHRRGSQ